MDAELDRLQADLAKARSRTSALKNVLSAYASPSQHGDLPARLTPWFDPGGTTSRLMPHSVGRRPGNTESPKASLPPMPAQSAVSPPAPPQPLVGVRSDYPSPPELSDYPPAPDAPQPDAPHPQMVATQGALAKQLAVESDEDPVVAQLKETIALLLGDLKIGRAHV